MSCTITQKTIFDNEDCLKILNQYKKSSKNVKLVNYNIRKLSDKVVGFLGDHFILELTFNENELKKIKEFFVKSVPIFHEGQYQYVKTLNYFTKECLIYKNLISKFVSITGTKVAPTCYYIKNNEVLVLEDLHNSGYSMIEDTYLTPEQCESVVKTLAKFHAASIIYEEGKSTESFKYRIGDHYTDEIAEGNFSFVKGHPRQRWADNVFECVVNCFKTLPNLEENLSTLEANYHKILYEEVSHLIGTSKKYRNVLTHSDLWLNNMMFTKNNDCMLVDFQFARYTPPAEDLLLTLYINNKEDYIRDNLPYLLNLYFDTFTNELKKHNVNPDEIYTRDHFMDSIKHYKLLALLECAMFGTIVLISDELSSFIMSDLEKFEEYTFNNRSKYFVKEIAENKTIRDRFMAILNPFIEELLKLK